MVDLFTALATFGGVATRAQLVAAGISPLELSHAAADERIRRVRRAHYALPSVAGATIAAVRLGGRLGCLSATTSFGLWAKGDDHRVHVSLPRNAARLRTNRVLVPLDVPLTPDRHPHEVVLHWDDATFGQRAPDEVAWRVPLPHALAEVAHCQPRVDVLAAFESAVTNGLLDLVSAQRLLDLSAPRRLGPVRLSGVDGSGAETYLAHELRALAIPFVQQVPFDGVGWIDFLVDGRLPVEVDGYTYHSDRDAFRRDRRRDEAMLRHRMSTLRFPADEVVADPREAALRVIRALAAIAA